MVKIQHCRFFLKYLHSSTLKRLRFALVLLFIFFNTIIYLKLGLTNFTHRNTVIGNE